MSYIILFEDNEEFASKRQEHMKDHLTFLESNSDKISAAGPLFFNEDQTSSAGGIWIVNADSKEDVETLIKEDPFWPTGLRKSFKILTWKQVYVDGKRLVHP